MIFVLCGAGGFRVGEALGIEIDKHISPDFLSIFVQQKIPHGRVEQRLKTANSFRQVDLHPTIAALLKEFVGNRASAFLFCARQGNPSHRQTSSVGICTRPLRNWVTSIRSPERIKLGTMRSVGLETHTCGTMRSVPMAYTSTSCSICRSSFSDFRPNCIRRNWLSSNFRCSISDSRDCRRACVAIRSSCSATSRACNASRSSVFKSGSVVANMRAVCHELES
jgi:hypothetical protein